MVDWIAVLRAVEIEMSRALHSGARWMQLAAHAAADELERQRDAAQGNGEVGEHVPSPAGSSDQRAPSPASSAICDFRPDSTMACSRGTQGCGRWHEVDAIRAKLAALEDELVSLRTDRETACAAVTELKAALAEREAARGGGEGCMGHNNGAGSRSLDVILRENAERETEAFRAKLAEREKLIDATATAWLAIDGIPWEGAIDEAMKAAVAELVRLRAQLAEREAELAALRSSERERKPLVDRALSTFVGGYFDLSAVRELLNHERARRAKEK